MTNLHKIPSGLLYNILQRLPDKDVKQICEVGPTLHKLICGNNELWQYIVNVEFPQFKPYVDQLKQSSDWSGFDFYTVLKIIFKSNYSDEFILKQILNSQRSDLLFYWYVLKSDNKNARDSILSGELETIYRNLFVDALTLLPRHMWLGTREVGAVRLFFKWATPELIDFFQENKYNLTLPKYLEVAMEYANFDSLAHLLQFDVKPTTDMINKMLLSTVLTVHEKIELLEMFPKLQQTLNSDLANVLVLSPMLSTTDRQALIDTLAKYGVNPTVKTQPEFKFFGF